MDIAGLITKRTAHAFALALIRIQQERIRQIEREGWSIEHDDQYHGRGQLLAAARCYLHHGTDRAGHYVDGVPKVWPWGPTWWKPRDRAANLVRAGALAMAEQGRQQRKLERRVRADEGWTPFEALRAGPADAVFQEAIAELAALLKAAGV